MNEPRMTEESLRELLARVHRRLGESDSTDEASRELLGTVMGDIERTLGRGRTDLTSAARHAPRLESLAVRFEADHPALAEVLREVIDALGKVGI